MSNPFKCTSIVRFLTRILVNLLFSVYPMSKILASEVYCELKTIAVNFSYLPICSGIGKHPSHHRFGCMICVSDVSWSLYWFRNLTRKCLCALLYSSSIILSDYGCVIAENWGSHWEFLIALKLLSCNEKLLSIQVGGKNVLWTNLRC